MAKTFRLILMIDGTLHKHYYNYSFIPLVNRNGNTDAIMNTFEDVTDLHKAKLNKQSADERIMMAIDFSGIGTYEIDLATAKIKTSANFNKIFSLEHEASNEELIAKLHPKDQIISKKVHAEAELTGEINYETQVVSVDQTVKWLKISCEIMKNGQGTPTTIFGIVTDINEQKEFEKQLKKRITESTKELIRSNNDLLHFANVVSHDLREPVRKIKIFNALLINDQETHLTQKSKKYLSKIDQSADRMSNLIEGVLAYSTLDKIMQSMEKIDLNEIITNIKIDLELIIKEKGAILLTCDFPKIEGIPILISQLFYNLIQNALKFSKADEPPRVVISSSITNSEVGDSIEITIKDNGIGIDDAFAEKIFIAFERLHSKDLYEGNGLGLALCRKIV